ncbi:MAG: phosphoenolpyruvate synthase [Longimicrobiales bacterium]|nr:phosphoenolpyruvate synthase [Longimicrobiales bacterium]
MSQEEGGEDRGPERWVRPFEELTNADLGSVGGKNASLGEMVRTLAGEGVQVPSGFATTAAAYWRFVDENDLREGMRDVVAELGTGKSVGSVGKRIREMVLGGEIPSEVAEAVRSAYATLSEEYGGGATDVAVRSSATAEDLPEASFAGQQESYLNVRGEEALLDACRRCYASLFTDRALAYREEKGFDHMDVALSVGVQKMVRSDCGAAGVMFTLDTETGFPDVVLVDGAWGLGEAVVQGMVNPDRFLVFKPFLRRKGVVPIVEQRLGDKARKVVYREDREGGVTEVDVAPEDRDRFVLEEHEILQLARWATAIETHYERPMDIEWAKDGTSGELFIVQARPETVESAKAGARLKTYTLQEQGEVLARGAAIGGAVAAGRAVRLDSPEEADDLEKGAILVTGRTDPDWGPVLERVGGIVTDRGGRTSHAAIVSRELGIPAVVGTGDATRAIADGDEVTVSCAEGAEGRVYAGALAWDEEEIDVDALPSVDTPIMMIVADPATAFRWWRLPVKGIGIARIEFIIADLIGIHPVALTRLESVEDPDVRERIRDRLRGAEPEAFFVDTLAREVARIAASRYPDPVVVRTSDFKTNEYAQLLGGRTFEPAEDNPMLGFRGASRYYSDEYREGFRLECRALRRARVRLGFDNIVPMIPFCRTPEEADRVLALMSEEGLRSGDDGLRIYVMCEVPSNVVRAGDFAERFDGFSIGSNDLTQLVLGVDRDSERLRGLFDERDVAVKEMIRMVIERAHAAGRPVGICGQAPSDHPDFASFLVGLGIDSISVNPDSVADVIRVVADAEAE